MNIKPQALLNPVTVNRPLGRVGHVTQLLGGVDDGGNYVLPADIARTLLALRKVETVNPDKIDIGNITMFESVVKINGRPIKYALEEFNVIDNDGDLLQKRAVLYLAENALEMGGVVAHTYMTPLAIFDGTDPPMFRFDLANQLNLDFDAAFDPEKDQWYTWYGKEISDDTEKHPELEQIKLVKEKKAKQRKKQLEEAERGVARFVAQIIDFLRDKSDQSTDCAFVEDEIKQMEQQTKRYVRPGKADYNQARLQIVEQVISRNDMANKADLAEVQNRLSEANAKIEKLETKLVKKEAAEKARQNHINHRNWAMGLFRMQKKLQKQKSKNLKNNKLLSANSNKNKPKL